LQNAVVLLIWTNNYLIYFSVLLKNFDVPTAHEKEIVTCFYNRDLDRARKKYFWIENFSGFVNLLEIILSYEAAKKVIGQWRSCHAPQHNISASLCVVVAKNTLAGRQAT
jgi:hypothetical protein